MKKLLLIAVSAMTYSITAAPRLSAQSAMFIYSGVPIAPLLPGSSFTVGLSLQIDTGGEILSGFSYWWTQQTAGPSFPFAVTARQVTGFFTELQSGVVFPQIMDPINRNPNGTQNSTDLGALIPIGGILPGSGTYPVVNLTFSIAAGAAPGAYILSNSTSTTPGVGNRVSVWFDLEGDITPISASPFTITVVPEPGSFALMVIGAVGAGLAIYSQRRIIA